LKDSSDDYVEDTSDKKSTKKSPKPPPKSPRANTAPSSSTKKDASEIYVKKTPHEHVLSRPDSYVGSIEMNSAEIWVYDEDLKLNRRKVKYIPGLYKIFDEILVNAADHKQRDPNMNTIKVIINPEQNLISVWNNGQG
jgi:DNA topoisomerase II